MVDIATPVSFGGFSRTTLETFAPQLRALGLEPRRAMSKAGKVALPKTFAHMREQVHHFIVVSLVATNGRKDQSAIPLEKQLPRRLGVPCAEWSDPGFHHGRSRLDGGQREGGGGVGGGYPRRWAVSDTDARVAAF